MTDKLNKLTNSSLDFGKLKLYKNIENTQGYQMILWLQKENLFLVYIKDFKSAMLTVSIRLRPISEHSNT